MNLPRLEIRNIKVSCFLDEDFPEPGIYEGNNGIMTIYDSDKRLINITGIKTLNHLYTMESNIQKVFNVKIKKTKIDAIMLSRRVRNKRFSERKYLKVIEKYEHIFKRDYNHEMFHSPWFKSNGRRGSFNVFSTGSCTVMGVKSVSDIKLIEEILDEAFCEENEIKIT